MARADTQSMWEARIEKAKKCRDDWAEQFKVQLARDFFEGKQNPGWPASEWITINKIYSHMQAQLPLLYQLDPYFYVKVKRSYSVNPMDVILFEKRGKVRSAYLNYLKGEIDLKEKAQLAIQDAHFAYGVLKTHYTVEEVENERFGELILDEKEQPIFGDDGEPLTQPEFIPINERYKVSRVHPDDLLWDDDAGTLEDKWCWIAERVTMTEEQIKADKTLNQSIVKDVEPGVRDTKNLFNKIFAKDSSEEKSQGLYEVYEIYDLAKKQYLKILTGATKPVMLPRPVPGGVDKHPYTVLRFTLRDNSPYPIPPISQGIDPQKEYGEARSGLLRHRKRFNRKYEVAVAMLEDESELGKLEAGDDGTIIRVMQTGAIKPITDAPLDQANYLEINALNSDMVEVLGSPDNARGVSGADSATEASILDSRLEVREGDRMSRVVDWITKTAENLDNLVQTHITKEEAVSVSGPEGEFWELVRPDDYAEINGDFAYSVNVGSSMARMPQIERAQFLAFLQVMAQFPHLMTAPKLMKRVAEMHRIDDESLVKELVDLGGKIMSGEMQPPGATGSQPGVPTENPITQVLGAALGSQGPGNAPGGV